MPLRDYKCVKCNHIWEVFHKTFSEQDSERENQICPECGGKGKWQYGTPHNEADFKYIIDGSPTDRTDWLPNYKEQHRRYHRANPHKKKGNK